MMNFKILILSGLFLSTIQFVSAQPCTSTFRPVILVHGFLGSGDNYGPLVRHLSAAGYCPEQFFAYDWNSLARTDQNTTLDKFIDSVLALTGAKQADLIGHSAGGGIGYAYLSDSMRATKIAHYIHIGSGAQKQPAGFGAQIPTLNLYSKGDFIVKSGDIPGATNIAFAQYDHFEVVTADSTAMAIYNFCNEGKPFPKVKSTKVNKTYQAKGRVVSLGENIPQANAKLTLQEVTAEGMPGKKLQELTTAASGRFVLNAIQPQKSYMLTCIPAAGRKVVYYFPNIRSNEQLLYVRTLPAAGMVAFLLSSLPADSNQMAMVIFSSQKAVIHGRDQLYVNGLVLSTEEMAKPEKTAIAWFLYDANKNLQSDVTPIAAFNTTPFLRGVDLFLPMQDKQPVSVKWQDKTYKVPPIPSSDAVMIVVL